MRILITNTLTKREYIYDNGDIIYLDSLKKYLTEIIEHEKISCCIPAKDKKFLFMNEIISWQYIVKNDVVIPYNKEAAIKLYNKYFSKKSYHIKNPVLLINGFFVDVLADLVFPGVIFPYVFSKCVKIFAHKDL